MRRYIVLQLACLLCVQCAIAPKYRSTRIPAVPAAASGIPSAIPVPDDLINAHSLQTIYGTASWYGPNFHGRLTANGEVYDMNKNSAAHKELPFNTWIRVTNLRNNRSIITRINDRGPYIKGRILDLSKGAAEQLDMVIDGVVEVKIEILKWGTIRDFKFRPAAQ
ncbi:septal ring lytic transglycosylase RlpA family protein [candidate division KSB1 bacterium]